MFLYYAKFVAVLIAGILMGRWYDQERKKLKARGKPWHRSWLTPPGILILIILSVLIAFRVYLSYSS